MFNNQSYDEYIRSILGYSSNNQMDMSYEPYGRNYNNMNAMRNTELEDCYPEIYKVVYPMVKKACQNNTKPLSKDLVEELTDEIYTNMESNEGIQININVQNQIENAKNTTNNTNTQNRSDVKPKQEPQNRQTRPINRGLSDIIKILILRELLGRPQFPRK